jgi:hypothetical protein
MIQMLHNTGVSFIAAPSTAALLHRKPSSAGTSRDSCAALEGDKTNTLHWRQIRRAWKQKAFITRCFWPVIWNHWQPNGSGLKKGIVLLLSLILAGFCQLRLWYWYLSSGLQNGWKNYFETKHEGLVTHKDIVRVLTLVYIFHQKFRYNGTIFRWRSMVLPRAILNPKYSTSGFYEN